MIEINSNGLFERELIRFLGKNNLRKIKETKIGIAGAGGLGSNCAVNLVRSGFSKFKIVDFDKVALSNLNRQFYFSDQVGMFKVEALKINLLRINSSLELEMVKGTITEENVNHIFTDCDVIVEAFDKTACKTLLVEGYYSSGKFLVSASGLAGWGRSDFIVTQKVHSNFCLVGDLVSEVSADNPPLSPRVNIAAAKQADLILEHVIGDRVE